MIKRVVKMSFRPEACEEFQALFEATKDQIRAFPGCRHLELLQDVQQPNVLFTLSYWTGEEALNRYRHSALFEKTWASTKMLFNDKPQAWSMTVVSETGNHHG
jgi:quinol monooxygenase YgiN